MAALAVRPVAGGARPQDLCGTVSSCGGIDWCTLPLARGGAGARLARGAATAAGCRLGLERGEWRLALAPKAGIDPVLVPGTRIAACDHGVILIHPVQFGLAHPAGGPRH